MPSDSFTLTTVCLILTATHETGLSTLIQAVEPGEKGSDLTNTRPFPERTAFSTRARTIWKSALDWISGVSAGTGTRPSSEQTGSHFLSVL
jgi:hypothetical protein